MIRWKSRREFNYKMHTHNV